MILLEAGTGDVQLVGVSHECDYPPLLVENLPQLTSSTIKFTSSAAVDTQVREHLATGAGLYAVDKEKLDELRPDVIVTQSLCKVCSVDYCVVEQLAAGMALRPTLVDTNPQSLAEVLDDLVRVGRALNLENEALAVRRKFEARIHAVQQGVVSVQRHHPGGPRACPSVVVLEWTDPMFVGGHWTPQLVSIAGGRHPLNPGTVAGGAGASTTVTAEALCQSEPDIIVIAPCGLDLEKTIQESKVLMDASWWAGLKAVKSGAVYFVDGNQMFSRPGPRLVDALEWLATIIHGDARVQVQGGVETFPALRLDDCSLKRPL